MPGTSSVIFSALFYVDHRSHFDGATPTVQRQELKVLSPAKKSVPKGWMIDTKDNLLTRPDQTFGIFPHRIY